jgi:O-antigen/teichoic acid export membrane protein
MLIRSVLALGLKGGIVVAGFGMQVILARTLGPEGLGVYATFLSLVTVLSITGGFGMPMAAVRFMPVYVAAGHQARLRGFVRDAQRVTLATSLPIAIAFCAVFALFPALRDQLGVAIAAAALIPIFGLCTLSAGMLQALGQPLRSDLLVNLARTVLIAGLILLAWWFGHAEPATALWLTGLAALIAWGAAAIAARRAMPAAPGGPAESDERHHWITAGMTFVLAMAAVSLIERLDTIMLGTLVGAEAAGIYSVASRLSLTVALATTSVLALMAPALARQAAASDRVGMQRTASIAVALAVLMSLCIAAVLAGASPWLLPAFGPDFDAAAAPFAILLAGQVAVAACGSAGGLLAVAGLNRALVVVAIAAVILDMVLCLLLVPVFGKPGAAGATVATLLAQALALAVVAWRRLGVDPTLLGAARLAWRSYGPGARQEGTP